MKLLSLYKVLLSFIFSFSHSFFLSLSLSLQSSVSREEPPQRLATAWPERSHRGLQRQRKAESGVGNQGDIYIYRYLGNVSHAHTQAMCWYLIASRGALRGVSGIWSEGLCGPEGLANRGRL